MTTTYQLRRPIPEGDLLSRLEGSQHMQSQGYEILYSRTYSDEKEETEADGGVTRTRTAPDPSVTQAYGLCYSHATEFRYIHLRAFPQDGEVSELVLKMGFGDDRRIDSDLVGLVTELGR